MQDIETLIKLCFVQVWAKHHWFFVMLEIPFPIVSVLPLEQAFSISPCKYCHTQHMFNVREFQTTCINIPLVETSFTVVVCKISSSFCSSRLSLSWRRAYRFLCQPYYGIVHNCDIKAVILSHGPDPSFPQHWMNLSPAHKKRVWQLWTMQNWPQNSAPSSLRQCMIDGPVSN